MSKATRPGVLPVFDPARGVQTSEVTLASVAEVDDAVKVAAVAAAEWGTLTAEPAELAHVPPPRVGPRAP